MSALVLVEFAEDAPEAVRTARRERAGIVALTPDAMQALDEAGAAYAIWTDAAQQAREDDLAYENLTRLPRVCAAIDEAVLGALGPNLPAGFSFANCWRQPLLVLLDALAFRGAGLLALLAAHDSTRVFYFRPLERTGERLTWPAGESVWAAVLAGAFPGLAVDRVAVGSKATPAAVRRRIFRSRLSTVRRAGWMRARAAARRAADWVRPRAAERPDANPVGGRVLILGRGAELDRAATALTSWDVLRWPHLPAANRGIPLEAVQAIAGGSFHGLRESGLLLWPGFDAAPAIERRWSEWVGAALPSTLARFEASARALADLSPDLILHGEVGPDVSTRTVLEAAASLRIPRIIYQWGGNYGYVEQPYLACQELRSDLMLTYTPAVARDLRTTATAGPDPVPPARAVGSFYFAEFRRGSRHAAGDALVYAPSALTGAYRYGPHLCLDDTALFALERRIVGTLARRFPGRLIVKLHPGERLAVNPIRQWMERSGVSARVTSEPLEDVVPRAAVWVVDALATVFQQAAVTARPIVFVDAGAIRPTREALAAIAAAARHVGADEPDFEDHLCAEVERALTTDTTHDAGRFVEEYVGFDDEDAVALQLRAALIDVSAADRRLAPHS